MSKLTCPACGHEFEVEVRAAAPEPRPRRRWLRAVLLLAGLAAAGGCAWALMR